MIDLNDLRHAMSRALDLGRYTITVGVAGGEQVPESITLDLLERDDDGFHEVAVDFDWTVSREQAERMSKRAMEAALRPTITPEGDALVYTVTDDHGAAIPAQGPVLKDDWTELDHMLKRMAALEERAGVKVGPSSVDEYIGGPRIYEFALQDIRHGPLHESLSTVELEDAPDRQHAEQADWVHVYDRVTRERRTLKRPEPDAVLTGLRDVAADLRRQSFEGSDPSKPYDGSGMVKGMADLSPLIVTRGGVPVEDQKAGLEEFKAACMKPDPMPPVGPLTSTEGAEGGGCAGVHLDAVVLGARSHRIR